MATLKAQMNSLSLGDIQQARFGAGDNKGFRQLINDTGAFRVHAIKAKSAVESYTDALQKQDVVFRGWRKNAQLRNQVLKEQYRLQNMAVMGWKEDGLGRISADMIIPRDVPARLESFKKSIAEVRAGQVGLGTVLDEQRMRIGLWSQSVKSATHNMINWGKNTQWAGRQMMVGLSLPFAALAAGTGLLAYQVDKEMTRILKVYDYATTNLEAEGQRIREASMQTAKSVARDYGQAATDTLNIMGELAATGKTGADLQETATLVSKAAFLGELDRQDAIKTTITLQTVYNQSNKELAESFAYLNSLENATSLSMRDMTVAIPKLAGVVNSLGGDVTDIGTLMTAAKAGGLEAAEGANALKTVLFRSVVPYGKGKETFLKATNIDLTELVKSTNGEAIPTLIKMGEAMKGLDQIERTAVLKDVFGIYQGSKAGVMIEQMLNIADATTQVGQAAIVAQEGMTGWAETQEREIAMMQASASGQFKIAIESIKAELADMGEPFLEVATIIIQKVTSILGKFNELGDGTKKFILLGLALAAIVGPAVMITGVMATFIGTIMRSGATMLMLASRFKAVNADQHAATLLAKQSTLAFQSQGTAAQLLSHQLNQLTLDLKKYALASHDATAGKMSAGSLFMTPSGNARVRDVTTGKTRRATKTEIEQANQLKAQRDLIAGSETLDAKTDKVRRNYSAIAGGIGGAVLLMSTLTGNTNTWVLSLGMAMMFLPQILSMLKGIAATQAFITLQGKISGVLGLLGGKGAGAKSGLKGTVANIGKLLAGFAPALGPLGGALLAAGAGFAFMAYKAGQARKEAEALANASKGIAGAMGVELLSTGEYMEGADKKVGVRGIAEKFEEENKETVKQLRNLRENIKSETDREEFKNRVLKIGFDIYEATGDAEKAQQAVQAALIAAGDPEMHIAVNFGNDNWEQEIRQQMLDGLAGASAGAFKTDGWFDPGMDENVKVQLEEQAEELGRAFGQFQSGVIDIDELKSRFQAVANSFEEAGAEIVSRFEGQFSKGQRDMIKNYLDSKGMVVTNENIARLLITDKEFQRSLEMSGGSTRDLSREIDGLRASYAYLSDKTVDATKTQNLSGVSREQLLTITGSLKSTTISAAGATKGLGDAADGASGDISNLTDELETAEDRAKSYVDALKSTFASVSNSVFDLADEQMSTAHEAHIDSLEAKADQAVDGIEARADKAADDIEARAKDLTKRHKDEDNAFTKAWKTRADDVAAVYDGRIKRIEDVMEAERKAEELRQRMFEAEQRRIQRLAEMYNQNVDFNVALNTGDMDEAAKLANNMRATQEQWGLDDAAAGAGDAAAARREGQEAEIDKLRDAKTIRMEALKEEEEAAKEILAARQEREKEALDAEKERARQSVETAKKSAKAKSDADIKAANDGYEARKKALEMELATLKAFTPKNEAELQKHVADIEALYNKHGFNLNTQSAVWADYVARAMKNATATAQMELSENVAWDQLGKTVGADLAQNILGMSFADFVNWMQTGNLPAHLMPATATRTAGRVVANPNAGLIAGGGGAVASSPKFNRGGQTAFHSGGPIHHNKGSGRAGRPLSAGLFSDEVPIIAQTGEFMMQRDAVDRIGIDNLKALNDGNLGPDRTGRMHRGGIVGGLGAIAQGMLTRGYAKAMMVGAARKAGDILSGTAPGMLPDGVMNMLSTGGTVGGPGRYGGTQVKFDAPGIPLVDGLGDLPPGVMGAAPPGQDGFASWLTAIQRQVRGDVLAKVFRGLAMVPGQQLITSGLRPGAVVAGTNRPSLHGSGRAVDIGALARKDGGTAATEAMGDHVARVFKSGVIPGVSEVLWKTMQGGNHFDHVHVGFRHGGGEIGSSMTKGLKDGGYTLNDGYAKLHRKEAVLTAPLTEKLHRGIDNLDSAGNVTYDIKMDLRGALIKEDIDIEAAVERAINKKESRMGRKRTIN